MLLTWAETSVGVSGLLGSGLLGCRSLLRCRLLCGGLLRCRLLCGGLRGGLRDWSYDCLWGLNETAPDLLSEGTVCFDAVRHEAEVGVDCFNRLRELVDEGNVDLGEAICKGNLNRAEALGEWKLGVLNASDEGLRCLVSTFVGALGDVEELVRSFGDLFEDWHGVLLRGNPPGCEGETLYMRTLLRIARYAIGLA